jgi:hypothetical protein
MKEHHMTDEPTNKPKVDGNVVALEQPQPAELDEEEAEFRALRLDLPGVKRRRRRRPDRDPRRQEAQPRERIL